ESTPDSTSEEPEKESVKRLEKFSSSTIDDALVPSETRPIEEDAWTLAPAPSRARVGASGIEVQTAEPKQETPVNTIDTKAIEQQIDDRFDRIEATMGIMEARLTQINTFDGVSNALPTDKLITIDEEGEASESQTSDDGDEENDGEDEEIIHSIEENLLDLYERKVADLNPFLNKREDTLSPENMVSTSEIVALLLDNLSTKSSTSFIEKAISTKMITKDEGSELMALITLADPQINADGSDHLPHRKLLMFSAMVDAWRDSRNIPKGE
ncbi:MAG TPA: hypothetical protein QF433_05780, partial [Candidatus Thalassarchaeaceae archaeon]|nr:hypothetical protein [Candidatus Thalassarchaeaceae archaeon]